MTLIRLSILLITIFTGMSALAALPEPGKPVPPLVIEENGELTYDGEEFGYATWESSAHPGKVHIIQYFGANFGDRDVFAPFTNRVQASFKPGTFHVTTILNLDAALWGTSGMVKSQVKENKKKHPGATIVVDKAGVGVKAWELGKAGTGLIIVNTEGVIEFFSPGALSQEQLGPVIKLIGENIAP